MAYYCLCSVVFIVCFALQELQAAGSTCALMQLAMHVYNKQSHSLLSFEPIRMINLMSGFPYSPLARQIILLLLLLQGSFLVLALG